MIYSIEKITTLIGARRIGNTDAQIGWLLTDSRSLCFPEESLFFALQSQRNDGTIIRTAVGAGFSDVYLVDSADAFSPKTVRASMGAVLRANVIKARAEELEDYLTGYDKVAMDIEGDDADVGHEAKIGRISDEAV